MHDIQNFYNLIMHDIQNFRPLDLHDIQNFARCKSTLVGSFIRKPGKDGMPIEEFNGGGRPLEMNARCKNKRPKE